MAFSFFCNYPGGCFCECFVAFFFFYLLFCAFFFSFFFLFFFLILFVGCAPALRKTGGMGIEMAMRCDVPAGGREAKNVRWIHRGEVFFFLCSSVRSVRSRRTHSSSLRMVIADFCSFSALLFSALLCPRWMRLPGTLQQLPRPSTQTADT